MDGLRLEIGDYHLQRKTAETHVFELARSLSISIPEHHAFQEDVQLANNQKTFRINFEEEIEHTMKMGKAKMLQHWFDVRDTFLQPAIEMATFSKIPGLSAHVTATVGNYSTSLKNYGVLQSPGASLADDIRFFHRETCSSFNNRNTSAFSRNYRAFLHSCVSVVEYFLHRYLSYVKMKITDTSEFDNLAILDSREPIEKRLRSWMMTFATHELDKFNSWDERSRFLELKKARNGFTHPSEPVVKYEPEVVKKYLDFGSSGVGKLLARMRRAAGSSDRIGFINQIASLPEVRLNTRG